MQISWEAHYLSGRTADREAVTVTVTPLGLRVVRGDRESLWWPFGEIRLTQGSYAGEHVRLERGEDPAEALVIGDRAFLDAVAAIAPDGIRTLVAAGHRGWRWRRLIALGGAALAVTAGTYLWLLPAAADAVARHVPVSWEEQLGNEIAEPMTIVSGLCDDSVLQDAVDGMVARLAGAAPDRRYRFRVQVADDPAVNAFAVPGGRIVVYRGLLARTGRAEELAGVLAHEMQHVILRHGTRAVLREIPIRVFVSMVAGDLVGAREAARAVGTLGVLRYGRRDELEADREGLRLLAAAGVDPGGMVAFFDTLAAVSAGLPRGFAYVSTHPPTAQRRATLAALAAAAPAAGWSAIDAGEWAALRARCRAA